MSDYFSITKKGTPEIVSLPGGSGPLSGYAEVMMASGPCQGKPVEGTGGIEDILGLKLSLALEQISDIASNLEIIDRTYLRNAEEIQWDIISVDNMIRRLPIDKKYFFSRERVDLEKQKLDLKKELRHERATKNQQAAMLFKELRETKLLAMKERAKASLIGLESAIKNDETGTNR